MIDNDERYKMMMFDGFEEFCTVVVVLRCRIIIYLYIHPPIHQSIHPLINVYIHTPPTHTHLSSSLSLLLFSCMHMVSQRLVVDVVPYLLDIISPRARALPMITLSQPEQDVIMSKQCLSLSLSLSLCLSELVVCVTIATDVHLD